MTSVGLDLSDFYAEQKTRGPQCGVGRALLALSPDDVARLTLALSTRDLQHAAIEAWLEKKGHPQGKGAVSRHRRKVCHCE